MVAARFRGSEYSSYLLLPVVAFGLFCGVIGLPGLLGSTGLFGSYCWPVTGFVCVGGLGTPGSVEYCPVTPCLPCPVGAPGVVESCPVVPCPEEPIQAVRRRGGGVRPPRSHQNPPALTVAECGTAMNGGPATIEYG